MGRFIVFVGMMLVCRGAFAACPRAEEIVRQEGFAAAMPLYEQCALRENDDETQYYLGQVYEVGRDGIVPNVQRALLFYHLSAEAGNAEAQVSLAQLLTTLDNNDALRPEIAIYQEKIGSMLQKGGQSSFRGELLHPYALLMLAAEKPDAKWFYDSSVVRSARAAQAFKQYQITPDKKEAAVQAATAWKQRKMLERARAVLSVEEYRQFYEKLYPAQGRSDDFTRARLLQKLKERITESK